MSLSLFLILFPCLFFLLIFVSLKSSHTVPWSLCHLCVWLSPQIESRKRLAKTVLVFVGLFAFCWLPNHVIYLYRSYHYSKVDTSMLHFVTSICARLLAFTNSCVNPFALYLLSKSFRKQFNTQLLCCQPGLLTRSHSTGRSTTCMTSLKSTNPSAATFSLINGNICHEGYV